MNYIKQNKIWSHVIAWLAIYILAVTLLAPGNTELGQTLLKTSVILISQISIFYLNLHVFLPKFLEQKKYVIYGVCVISLIVFLLWILYAFNGFSHPSGTRLHALESLRMRQLKANGGILNLGRFILLGLSMFGTLFISTILRNITQWQKKDRERIALENKILSAESQLLKSQLNPHFLFNSLNNIYALSQIKSEKTPESILRLSQLLSYVLYESEVDKVLLGQEIKYIESFVELQLLKDENCENIQVDLSESNPDLKIAPMILISFIENCFKHSHFDSADNWIRIKMTTKGSLLQFEASNSIPPITSKKDHTGGIGLENVKKRLDLIYSDKYELEITNDGVSYNVKLTIELNDI